MVNAATVANLKPDFIDLFCATMLLWEFSISVLLMPRSVVFAMFVKQSHYSSSNFQVSRRILSSCQCLHNVGWLHNHWSGALHHCFLNWFLRVFLTSAPSYSFIHFVYVPERIEPSSLRDCWVSCLLDIDLVFALLGDGGCQSLKAEYRKLISFSSMQFDS